MQRKNVLNLWCLKWMRQFVVVLVRGDHEVNDVKVKNCIRSFSVDLRSLKKYKELLDCAVGSLGPIGVTGDIEVIADHAVHQLSMDVQWANEEDSIM